MNRICFLDLETDKEGNILDIGCFSPEDKFFHGKSLTALSTFLSGFQYICGHNILEHDLPALRKQLSAQFDHDKTIIDTLPLSPLLFPNRPYHHLVKDEKLIAEELNNPVNDAKKCFELFQDEAKAYHELPAQLKRIYTILLGTSPTFAGFFKYLGIDASEEPGTSADLIFDCFTGRICQSSPLHRIIDEHPVALGYVLALINSDRHSVVPPWVLHAHPEIESILYLLRAKPCTTGCAYCSLALDPVRALRRYFNHEQFRLYGNEPLQENAVRTAIDGLSLLAVFPTGGGKSVTFQIPALMAGENERALTVIISPLQSLMKDQVDNLEKKEITDAVTINGLLDPIERGKAIERVMNGSAHILYISPESLRSITIEKLLLGRKIARFVIDEAHCFSAWGQDFRVDYLYIGDFIKQLQEKKGNGIRIPVSCFTATAKQKVIEDIRAYFQEKLGLSLQLFRSNVNRTNLHYRVFNETGDEEKYAEVRRLIESKPCPTIIYVSRTKKAVLLAQKLTADGFRAKPYHGKMDKQEKVKNQNEFIAGAIDIMVATSAFGMGVDKSDVGMVIHFEISDSLENYMQEAGRAGRDENITADCYILFNEDDLDKHFLLLNQTKLSIKEINQVWKAVKDLTKTRHRLQNSPLEIARKAGWDESTMDVETRITTAVAALEDAGYVKRSHNVPQVFANSILSKNADEAREKIFESSLIAEQQKENAVRVVKKLFSSKSKRLSTEEAAESRVDYISDVLGIDRQEVIRIVQLLKEENILANTKDITAFIKKGETSKGAHSTLDRFAAIERFLLSEIKDGEAVYNLKELNDHALASGCGAATPARIKTLLNLWVIRNWIERKHLEYSKNHVAIKLVLPEYRLQDKLERRLAMARIVIDHLHAKALELDKSDKEEVLVEFSVLELQQAVDNTGRVREAKASSQEIEECLFFLSRIEALKLEGGFLVVYNRLTIDRLEQNNKIQYKQEDYRKLEEFYRNKMQQIHIVGEYANKMLENEKEAQQFMDDYFRLNYATFLNKYFKGERLDDLKRNITPAKFRQLFGQLSGEQLEIVRDDKNKYIVVAAGPGSGKTRVLVHKLASLLLMEDVRHEHLLMLTFSRAAATEFKKRLIDLIGKAAYFVEIKTFHSYCFDLLGKVGNLTDADQVVKTAVERIRNGEIETARITKAVVVVDEAQDMNGEEYALIQALMHQNEEIRVILVGDDDQNIFEFKYASSAHMVSLIEENEAKKYELVQNYRSLPNLIQFSNQWLNRIPNRLKDIPIFTTQERNGVLRITEYKSVKLIDPVVQAILTADLPGTTCVLTQTNDDAEAIVGLLTHEGRNARLIQTNDGFRLYDLSELRCFTDLLMSFTDAPVITEEEWELAKHTLKKEYGSSNKLPWCQAIIQDFEQVNTHRKYKSDWNSFLSESKLEDFVQINGDTIFVSTIHKAKGKEFDNVFLVLDHFNLSDQQCLRQFYVAITRAKSQLQIHYTGNYLRGLIADGLTYTADNTNYFEPSYLRLNLTHTDVWLDYFENHPQIVALLRSGQRMQTTQDGMLYNGKLIVRFSRGFKKRLANYLAQGFRLQQGKINYIVYWKGQKNEKELQVILPEVSCQRPNK